MTWEVSTPTVVFRRRQSCFVLVVSQRMNFFGGMPFSFGGGGEPAPRDVDNNGLYHVLGVPQNATTEQIRSAFKVLARKGGLGLVQRP
jgi:hypothetical protein